MGSFGDARAFIFNLVRPQKIPQLSARLLSPRLPLFSKVVYVIARSAAKSFGNDVCKCSTSEGLFSWEIFRSSQLSFDRNYTEPRQCSQKITETSSDATGHRGVKFVRTSKYLPCKTTLEEIL